MAFFWSMKLAVPEPVSSHCSFCQYIVQVKPEYKGAVCLSVRGGLDPICHHAHLPCDPPSCATSCPAATSLRALLALRPQPKLLPASLSHIQGHDSPAASRGRQEVPG